MRTAVTMIEHPVGSRDEWRRFTRLVLFYAMLSLVGVILNVFDPVPELPRPFESIAAVLTLLLGPALMLLHGVRGIGVYVVETVIVVALVLWCVFLWRQSPPASMAVGIVTFFIWIACAFVAPGS